MLLHVVVVIKEFQEFNAFSKKMPTVQAKMLKFSVYLILEKAKQMLPK